MSTFVTSGTILDDLLAWLGLPPDAVRTKRASGGKEPAVALGNLTALSPNLYRLELRGPHARRTWRHLRRYMLTSTDWSAILGLNPNKNAWSVWSEKVKGPTPEEIAADELLERAFSGVGPVSGLAEAMRWGNILEDPAARETAVRINRRIIDHGRYTLFIRTDLAMPLGASLDREIEAEMLVACPHGCTPPASEAAGMALPPICEPCIAGMPEEERAAKVFQRHNGLHSGVHCVLCCGSAIASVPDPRGPGLMEIKTVGAFADPENEWSPEGRGPVRHQIQLQAGLCVTGWQWGVLSGLNGTPSFNLKYYEHARDDETIAWALDRLAVFWQYVRAKEPPPVDASETTAKALARFYDRDNGNADGVELPPIAAAYARELAEAKHARKAAEDRERGAKNALVGLLQDAKVGLIPGMDGGLRFPRIETKPSCCPSCKAVVSQKKPYRRLSPFGDAKFSELFLDEDAKEGE